MPFLSAGHVAAVCRGRMVGDAGATATRVVADSRLVDASTAFAAVRGGRAFVRDAIDAGAPLVIVDDEAALAAGASAVIVDDTVRALGALAADFRSSLDVRVVGITGSMGKTLTKDFLSAALGVSYRVHAAPSSYNNEIGVPLVILSCPDDAQIVVAELAARHRGEIAELCAMCRPDVGVLTGVGTSHLGEFGSRNAIAGTKSELLDALSADGLAVVPADDDFLALYAKRTAASLVTVGPGGAVGYNAGGIDASGRTHGEVRIAGEHVPVTMPIAGRPLMRNAAMALTVARALDVDVHAAAAAIANAQTTGRRMEVIPLDGWTIVNDAWNANPVSTASALRSVHELARGAEAWAVLGEMAELGHLSEVSHVRIGRLVASLGYAGVVVVGEAASAIADAAGALAHRVATVEEAADFVRTRVPAGSFVLVKGSRVTALDRFPDVLRAVASARAQEA